MTSYGGSGKGVGARIRGEGHNGRVDAPHPSNLSWSTIARAAAGDRKSQSAFSRSYLPVVRVVLEV